ncbi:MAG: hypothetical protein WCK29_01500 [archaeon]
MTLNTKENKRFTLTKRIAKHGSQAIIVVPRMLEQHLKPGMITQITIEIIENPTGEEKL